MYDSSPSRSPHGDRPRAASSRRIASALALALLAVTPTGAQEPAAGTSSPGTDGGAWVRPRDGAKSTDTPPLDGDAVRLAPTTELTAPQAPNAPTIVTPEPSTVALVGGALLLVGGLRAARRRR